MLIDRLDEYIEDPQVLSTNPRIAPVPPSMIAVPCKPLFFDLAYNHIEFPTLEDKVETKKTAANVSGDPGGLTGLVKGLWSGWGSKK